MNTADSMVPDPRWFEAPRERSPQFFLTYSKVSVALQVALRDLAPAFFFADLNHYKDVRVAYPMLVYAASRPFRPKTRTEFTYDVTNSSGMAAFFRVSRQGLVASLTAAQSLLTGAGLGEIAKLYDPRESRHVVKVVRKQERFRKPVHRFLVVEGRLLNELTRFSAVRERSSKDQAREAASIARNWYSILQHLCLGTDLSGLTAALFEAVTTAYVAANPPALNQPLDLAA